MILEYKYKTRIQNFFYSQSCLVTGKKYHWIIQEIAKFMDKSGKNPQLVT